MDYKVTEIMVIEEMFIDDSTIHVHTESTDYEVETDELINNLVSILGNQIYYDDYHFYEITNRRTWADKFDNEESEFEKIKIELSVVSEALLMSASLTELETI